MEGVDNPKRINSSSEFTGESFKAEYLEQKKTAAWMDSSGDGRKRRLRGFL